MSDETTTPPPAAATLRDENLIDMLMGAGLLMLAAQSNGDEAGRAEEERRMTELRDELLARLSARPEPGMTCISREDARAFAADTRRLYRDMATSTFALGLAGDYADERVFAKKQIADRLSRIDAALEATGPGA